MDIYISEVICDTAQEFGGCQTLEDIINKASDILELYETIGDVVVLGDDGRKYCLRITTTMEHVADLPEDIQAYLAEQGILDEEDLA
jgi:hypothetical protein